MAVDRLVDVAAHDNLRALLADVERAMTKLRDGTYGLCDRCGADIAAERLEALPWAVRCVRCADRR
jgi:DnaK suppressor protein